MLKFSEEVNWANAIGLRKKYNLPQHDDNVKKNMGVKDWKWIAKSTIYRGFLGIKG